MLIRDKTKLVCSLYIDGLAYVKATCDSFAKVMKDPELKINAQIIFSYRFCYTVLQLQTLF